MMGKENIIPRKFKKTQIGNSSYLLLPKDVEERLGTTDEYEGYLKEEDKKIYLEIWNHKK